MSDKIVYSDGDKKKIKFFKRLHVYSILNGTYGKN